MKAITYRRYGTPEVLEYVDTEKPTIRDEEVLIKVRAASVNPLDYAFMSGEPYLIRMMNGFRKPKTTRPGVDVAGEVDAVGSKVTRFKPGDEVFGAGEGSFAEYATAPAQFLAAKPPGMTFEQAASINIGGVTALQSLRNTAKLQSGDKLLINGASGGVGTFAVQLAKYFGAHVSGVCSTRNVEMVRSIGADRVIDYTKEDFTRSAEKYDVIFDNIGNHSLLACRRALNPKGKCVLVGGEKNGWIKPLDRMFGGVLLSMFVSQKFQPSMTERSGDDLAFLSQLFEEGRLEPVIERTYTLAETPEAMRHLGSGHARGKIIIRVS